MVDELNRRRIWERLTAPQKLNFPKEGSLDMIEGLSPGDRLEVRVGRYDCVSDVQEIKKLGRLAVSLPMFRSVTVPVAKGETLQVSYYGAEGKYSFVAKVADKYRDGELDLIELDVKSPVSKYQRREFVRLDVVVPVSVRLIALPEHIAERTTDEILHLLHDSRNVGVPRPALEGEEIYKCYTVDMSGGGLRFVSREKFKQGSLVECTVRLEEANDVTVDAQIVRAEEGVGRMPDWRVCAQFVNIDERIRRAFIKYIFERQAREQQRTEQTGVS